MEAGWSCCVASIDVNGVVCREIRSEVNSLGAMIGNEGEPRGLYGIAWQAIGS